MHFVPCLVLLATLARAATRGVRVPQAGEVGSESGKAMTNPARASMGSAVPGPPGAVADPRLVWGLSLADIQEVVAIEGGVLVGTSQAVWAVGADDGAVAWTARLPGGRLPGLAVRGPTVAAAVRGGRLVAIDLATGAIAPVATGRDVARLVGLAELRERGSSTLLAVVQETVGRLAGIDLATGEVRWKSPEFDSRVAPAMAGGPVIALRGCDLSAIEPADGSVIWHVTLASRPASLAVDGTAAYALDSNGHLSVFDLSTGAPVYTAFTGPGRTVHAAAGALWTSGTSDLALLGRDDGALVRRAPLGPARWAVPVGDKLVGPDASGRLVAVDPAMVEALATAGRVTLSDADEAEIQALGQRLSAVLVLHRRGEPAASVFDHLLEAVPIARPVLVAGRSTRDACTTTTVFLDLSDPSLPRRPATLTLFDLTRISPSDAPSWRFDPR